MNSNLVGRDILNLRDLTPDQFRYLINLSWELKAQKKSGVDQRHFCGKNVVANFMWSSTRTRCAFETSCNDLGMGFTYLTNSHMGYDESKIGTDACNALVCANVTVVGSGEMPDVPVVMTHFLRPCEGGSELRSFFWFGWQIIDGKAVKSIPDGVKVPAKGPVCLLNHNVKEFANLARILPSLYSEEKDNWF